MIHLDDDEEDEKDEEQEDATEAQRQALITEIHGAESAFVARLQVFVQLFIRPLRVQNSKDWIVGVPSEVARLFDWLEDIVVLHTQLLAVLQAQQQHKRKTKHKHKQTHNATIVEAIRALVPRLEVYQPYLVKLMDVVTLIEGLMQGAESDFGEYVRLQEAAPECAGWTCQNFLVEPVNILAKFPEWFTVRASRYFVSVIVPSQAGYMSRGFWN